MQRNIIERVTNWKGMPQEAEREVVAAISSAEGSANLLRNTGRAVGIGVPLLSLAAGAMVGYGAARWFLPWLLRQPAIVARPTLVSGASSVLGRSGQGRILASLRRG